jgi:general nucleoside transport system ATP-binding protein
MSSTEIPVVEMRSVTKRFLDVVANDKVDFSLHPGEICALLGENGAGKTTLMNVLFGYYAHDGGEIYLHGEKVNLTSPKDAITRGIGMIHQHFTLVPTQSVLENIIIGTDTGKGLLLDYQAARERLHRLGEKFGLSVEPDALVWTLSVGEQQKIEILKALYRDAAVLIMDEPTAVLSPLETVELFKTLKKMVAEGMSVVFISHKLNEVMDISHRVVVLRNGRVTDERLTRDTTAQELANLMVGRTLLENLDKKELAPGDPVLEIERLSALNNKGLKAVTDLDLTIRAGEVLGIAGVSGNGQTELSEVLFGLRVPTSGNVKISGSPLTFGKPKAGIDRGLARVPEDRIETGLLMDMTVEENLVLQWHSREGFQKSGILNHNKIHEFSDERIETFSIKTDGRDAMAKSLSGGNLQKIILARELHGDPKLVIACQPTRGLDVGAMEFTHQAILDQREKGAGVLLISEDLDETFLLSDRIAVMYEGRIMGEMNINEASRERIGLWMSGIND